MRFDQKYDASPFDPDDPHDARAERARRFLVKSFRERMAVERIESGAEIQDLAGGMLVGIVCILAAHSESTDANHAHLRAGLLQLVPWAVDMVRSIDGMPPLSEN